MNAISRRTFVGAAGVAGAILLSGCSSGANTGNAGSPGGSTGSPSAAGVAVGTLATEDILPYWVASDQGLFDDAGIAADVVVFQSATELIAAVGAGEVDLAMTDIMVAASMYASGIDVQMKWVTLGTTADQGRFGIMVGPDSGVRSLSDLAGVPIGVGSNTILEYVMDRLMEGADIADEDVLVEELQKLPVRYQAMASGEVAAAALPGSLLALGEANGCRTIADDTTGDNISQSVMIARASSSVDIAKLEEIWNEAAAMINADPEACRETLVENANLSQEVAATYPISTYPAATLPTQAMVAPVLEWMEAKGYLARPLAYDAATGTFA